eukprot:TRINITY_DN11272_c0_g1_i2.p1 TRINITY_DN11272_c0_g1~~TRINITY_DN11272_c0_g1_i2.p1  ORF type:complete len:431 (+),score=92.81 TRINITY_DN11272_c0_g1_i2:114-1406(+)
MLSALCFSGKKMKFAGKSKTKAKAAAPAYGGPYGDSSDLDSVASGVSSPYDSDSGSLPEAGSGNSSASAPKKHFTKSATTQSGDKLVGVVVTIYSGSSYDPMFREVEPSSVPGERISTYSIRCSHVKLLHDYLVAEMPVPEEWSQLLEDIQTVPADSVIFNWECCSALGDRGFPCCERGSSRQRGAAPAPRGNHTMDLMELALQRGFSVMCSDFSLKSLIHDWSEEHLGPNPFQQIGETQGQVQLDFMSADLQNDEVPQQLQVVGQLCADRGSAIVHAMGGTIVYTVKPDRAPTEKYTLKVLTVANNMRDGRVPEHLMCSVGEGDAMKRGAAAHVTLTYASGGQLVTSMAHWIELTKMDTSLEAVLHTAAQEFGAEEVEDFRREYALQATDEARSECLQKRSKALISKSAPSRMKQKTKFSASSVLAEEY